VLQEQMLSHTWTDIGSHSDRRLLTQQKILSRERTEYIRRLIQRQISAHRTDVISQDRRNLTHRQMSAHGHQLCYFLIIISILAYFCISDIPSGAQ